VEALEQIVRDAMVRQRRALKALEEQYALTQRDKLRSIVARNEDTEFGVDHRFGDCGSVGDFQRLVPPSRADDYADAWQRMVQGEENVLCADPVQAFGLTSGTCGAAKLIPVTKALLRGCKRAIRYSIASYIVRTADYGIMRRYALQVAAATEVRRTDLGVPVGYITGLMGAARSYPFHNMGIPPREVLDLPDWNDKFTAITEDYLDCDVGMILGLPGYVRGLLRRITRERGIDDVTGLWPNLKVVLMSGGDLRTHREHLERYCPGAEMLEMYLATEAPVAFQPDGAQPGMMPLVEDVFLEFVPEDRWEEPNPPRLLLDEVETGVRYVILITTPAGLYAYSPGDIVSFVSVSPPRMIVEGRRTSVLNLAAEKVTATQAREALLRAGFGHASFTVCPLPGDELGHEWVVEGSAPPHATERLDQSLCELNALYRQVRIGEGLLAPPRITTVSPGAFGRALRKRPGQGKILPIYNDRIVRDELVALCRQ